MVLILGGWFFLKINQKENPIEKAEADPQVVEQSSQKAEPTFQKSTGPQVVKKLETEKVAHAGSPHKFLSLKKLNEPNKARFNSVQERIRSLSLSAKVQINESSFYLANARAVLASENNSNINPSIYSLAGYVIVKTEGAAPEDLVIGSDSKPVVVNSKNSSFGVVTGTIILKLKEIARAQEITDLLDLEVIFVDEATSRLYLKAPENVSLFGLISEIKKNNLIESVELEIIENTKAAR